MTERFAASRPEPASFPAIALQILNLVASPDAQVSELAGLVSRDPALSAGALSVANSAVYRGVQELETVREAVARLGVVELGRVATAVSARTLFSPRSRAEQAAFGERWNALFGHAVAVAEPDGPRLERILDRVHVELGAEAHQIWDLPHYLTVLCVRHHDEAVPADPEFVDLHLVRLTSALADLREPAFAARAAAAARPSSPQQLLHEVCAERAESLLEHGRAARRVERRAHRLGRQAELEVQADHHRRHRWRRRGGADAAAALLEGGRDPVEELIGRGSRPQPLRQRVAQAAQHLVHHRSNLQRL